MLYYYMFILLFYSFCHSLYLFSSVLPLAERNGADHTFPLRVASALERVRALRARAAVHTWVVK